MARLALTDPELDLLREMLVDSPAEEVFLEVGEELVRRLRWAEAEQVLSEGLAQFPADDPRRRAGFALLARASLETGRYDLTETALREIDTDAGRHFENARIELLWLERSGQLDSARERARSLLDVDATDLVAQAVLERLDMPAPSPRSRAKDPFYTVARAEQYVAHGRPDRAIRVYRRIQLALASAPAEAARVEQRLRQLAGDASGAFDDLSEELTDPGLVPELPDLDSGDVLPALVPRLIVPVPQIADPVASTEPEGGDDGGLPDALEDLEEEAQTTEESLFDEEDTEIKSAPLDPRSGRTMSTAPTAVPTSSESHARDRRKRRSLLRR